ncbi:hypothetical protein PIB30_035435 [Stylosanthes scabra]|uniref:Uncharacterized protein n=1 Tax=Stylosanthes scabra TaxID=79078 RepID=A0ABU6SDD3_9FABA|nr:hypothetical protein [Stylosanthes scabra]
MAAGKASGSKQSVPSRREGLAIGSFTDSFMPLDRETMEVLTSAVERLTAQLRECQVKGEALDRQKLDKIASTVARVEQNTALIMAQMLPKEVDVGAIRKKARCDPQTTNVLDWNLSGEATTRKRRFSGSYKGLDKLSTTIVPIQIQDEDEPAGQGT